VVKNICLVLLLVLVCTCSSHQDYFLFEMVIGMKGNFHKILLMRWKVMNFLLFLVVGDFGFVFWWLQGEHFCNSSFLILVNFVDCVWNSFMHMMYLCLYLTLSNCVLIFWLYIQFWMYMIKHWLMRWMFFLLISYLLSSSLNIKV
jgi:hypothetical protein